MSEQRTPGADRELDLGSGVLVRNQFDGRWASGFEIADVRRRDSSPPEFRILRRSDRRVLPGYFPPDQLRPT